MKQAIYYGIRDVKVEETAIPTIGENDVLVKNICAGICGTDVYAYNVDGGFARIFAGNEIGHEMVSEVVEVGKNVDSVKIGDRLYPFPLMAKADMSRSGTVGGFSEYITLPSFRLNVSAFLVDDSISNEAASLIEPLTVGYHAAKLTNPTDKNVIIFGAGMIGMASAFALRDLKAKEILITDISPLRLKIAEELGFKTCDVSKVDLVECAKTVFGDARGKMDVDCFIDAAGVKSNLDFFLNQAKFGATLCITAVYHDKVELDYMKLTFGQLHIVGSPAYDMQDVQSVLNMLKHESKAVEKIITHAYPLDEITDAFDMATRSKEGLKVIIDHRKNK